MASAFERIVDTIHETLDDPNVEKLCYRRSLSTHGKGRRIVWVPIGGRIDAATTPGVRPEHHEVSQTTRITALASKLLTVQAYIFAENDEILDKLHNNVLVAVAQTLQRGAQPGAFEIITETEAVAGNALNGQCLLMQEFVFDLVVPKQISQLAFISEQDHECEIDNDL